MARFDDGESLHRAELYAEALRSIADGGGMAPGDAETCANAAAMIEDLARLLASARAAAARLRKERNARARSNALEDAVVTLEDAPRAAGPTVEDAIGRLRASCDDVPSPADGQNRAASR